MIWLYWAIVISKNSIHMDELTTLNLEHLIPVPVKNVKVMVLLCGSKLKLPILYHKCCAYTYTKKKQHSIPVQDQHTTLHLG